MRQVGMGSRRRRSAVQLLHPPRGRRRAVPVPRYGSLPAWFLGRSHTHRTNYAEILLSGTLTVDRSELIPGDVRIVRAGTAYGPHIAGPEGCDLILVYREADPAAVPLNDKRQRGLTYDIDRSASTIDWEPPA